MRNAKATAAPYKTIDGDDMFLFVQPNGSKYWRWSYRFQRKPKTLAWGVYPVVSLAAARRKCDDSRQQLAARGDPRHARKEQAAEAEAGNPFEMPAR
ncbi:Arm DNA-binding domain-containing protein [Burkholderia sp. 22PA0099]|uniref:Arm DNA-binding domain-containing protein n=1 Tax=Burkholderia sp. 22PA0099 TaxID=3237372 RepID=UPI0039C3F9A5